ncbi:phage tail protein [Escherichia coli]
MPVNNFKAFATGASANVISQDDYEALTALVTGFTAGKASSAQVNKALRQATFIAAALAQFVADTKNTDVLDNGDLSTFVTTLTEALNASASSLLNSANTWTALQTFDAGLSGSLTGNADTATKLQTARNIGGVAFDGSQDINLPGVNQQGNQNTTGNAATATKLQTARKINGVSFDGTSDITISSGTVTAVRLGTRQNYSPTNNESTWDKSLDSGNVMTGIYVQDTGSNSADNIARIYYRPVQYCINGSWVTASSV